MDEPEAKHPYGPWRPRTPDDVVELLRDYPGRWWVAGGWAIEAFTGVSRRHGDVDPSIPRSDVTLLREHLRGTMDVWSADRGTLRALQSEDDDLSVTCENLWLRPREALIHAGRRPRRPGGTLDFVADACWTIQYGGATAPCQATTGATRASTPIDQDFPRDAAPWEFDVILMDTDASTWAFKRDRRISRPFDDILWTRDGIDYLRPEVQLLHKARDPRPKDQHDFEACLPRLDDAARHWLADALEIAHPGHPWLGPL